MRQTSLLSYIQLKIEKRLGEKQQKVFAYISGYPSGCSDRQISEDLNMPINCVTGRRNELLRMGLIREKGKRYDEQTNRIVYIWGVC